MAANKAEIAEWLRTGQQRGASHVVVVCDTFDHDDFPVYVQPDSDETVHDVIDERSKNMQRVMEVYKLSMDLEAQLNEPLAYHL